MSGRLEGKVALITGAARGQGASHAVRFAAEGADIIALDICAPIRGVTYPAATPDDLTTTVAAVERAGRRVVSAQVDTRDVGALTAAVDGAVAELGRLDVVVANAGICIMRPWDQVTAEIWGDTIDINLTGTWNSVRAGIPHLIAAGGGSVVITSSAAGLKGLPFLAPYVASKHALTGLARALAHELAEHAIRVNSLHPTGVATPMGVGDTSDVLERALGEHPRIGGMYTNSLPIDVTEPEDVTNAALFLASDEARHITALAMTVDAGNSQY